MRTLALLGTALLLHASALGLAAAPAVGGPALTPSCQRASYEDGAGLLAALAGAGYGCAEEIAAALAPRADAALVDALVAAAESPEADARARRNALRALGRLAESPRASRAGELLRRGRAAAVQRSLDDILAREGDSFLLQDAIWIYDSFYFPSFHSQAALARISARAGLDPNLRARAARAAARLIGQRTGALAEADRAFMAAGLRSEAPGVRAEAALAIARLRDGQLGPTDRGELDAALAAAWAAEPALALARDEPAARDPAISGVEESVATPLAARAAIARAQDRLAGGGARLSGLRAAYEALALPARLDGPGLRIRAGLPAAALPPILERAGQLRAAFAQLLGPELAAPLPDAPAHAPISLLIFASPAIYRDYMRAFTPFGVDVDGVYDEARRTLYTHQRRPEQSENSLDETMMHELAHALGGDALFPGVWATPGYHSEPKGWADEGLAELLAGLQPAGAGFRLAPRPRQLARLCARAAPPALAELLARRAGYDRFGRFDYDGAWALSYYLFLERPGAARRIFAAYRDGSYRLADWPGLADAPLAEFESGWHTAIARWCAA